MTPISALSTARACLASSLEYFPCRWTVSPRSCAATTSGSGLAPGLSGAAKTPATWSPRPIKASSTALPKACWPTMTMRIPLPPIASVDWRISRRARQRQVCRAISRGQVHFAPRQEQSHCGAMADFAAYFRRTAGLTGEAVNHAEAKTGTFGRPLCRKERLERPGQHLGRHSRAGVGDLQTDKIPACAQPIVGRPSRQCRSEGSHAQDAAFGHGIASVYREIDHRQLELSGVDIHRPQTRGQIDCDLDPAADGPREQLRHPAQQVIEVDARDGQRLPPRKGKELPGQLTGSLDRSQRHVYSGLELGILLSAVQEFETALENCQEIVEIVSHSAGQLAQRFHFLCLVELRLGQGSPVHLPFEASRRRLPAPGCDFL